MWAVHPGFALCYGFGCPPGLVQCGVRWRHTMPGVTVTDAEQEGGVAGSPFAGWFGLARNGWGAFLGPPRERCAV